MSILHRVFRVQKSGFNSDPKPLKMLGARPSGTILEHPAKRQNASQDVQDSVCAVSSFRVSVSALYAPNPKPWYRMSGILASGCGTYGFGFVGEPKGLLASV